MLTVQVHRCDLFMKLAQGHRCLSEGSTLTVKVKKAGPNIPVLGLNPFPLQVMFYLGGDV